MTIKKILNIFILIYVAFTIVALSLEKFDMITLNQNHISLFKILFLLYLIIESILEFDRKHKVFSLIIIIFVLLYSYRSIILIPKIITETDIISKGFLLRKSSLYLLITNLLTLVFKTYSTYLLTSSLYFIFIVSWFKVICYFKQIKSWKINKYS